jgi:hypothetical protein
VPVGLVVPTLALDIVGKGGAFDEGVVLLQGGELSDVGKYGVGSGQELWVVLVELVVSDSCG